MNTIKGHFMEEQIDYILNYAIIIVDLALNLEQLNMIKDACLV